MSKYEEAIKQGLNDDDIANIFQPKMQTALTQMGEGDTQSFLSTQMGLPEHLVNKLLGKQIQPEAPKEDLSPEAKAAPSLGMPSPGSSFFDRVSENVTGFGKEVARTAEGIVNTAKPSLEQSAGAVVGIVGEGVRAVEKATEFVTGTPQPTMKQFGGEDVTVGQKLQTYSDEMDAKWEKEYGKKLNLPKLITDVSIGLALPAMQTEKALTVFGALKNIVNPSNVKSVLTSVMLTDAQLRRDDVPNAEKWAIGFGAFQGIIPVVSSSLSAQAVNRANAYMDDVLRLKPEDYQRELAVIGNSRDLSGLSEFEKRVLVASAVSPQAAAALEKVILSNDKFASAVFQQLINKSAAVDNITQAETSSFGMTVRDTQAQIKSQYGQMSEKISNATKTMTFNLDDVKGVLANVEDSVVANLLGKDKALATINKIKASSPTTYDEMAELTADLGKRIRQLPDHDSAKSGLETLYKGMRNSIETQAGKYASQEGKDAIKATIQGQNEAYAFLKQELEKTDLFKSTLFKNMTPDEMHAQLIRVVQKDSHPELTQEFLDVLNRVKQTTNPELVEQGIIKQIIEGSKKQVSDAGIKLVDFAHLSSTLDNLPEGLIASPQAKLIVESLQDIASFSKYDFGLAKSISKFGGIEAQQLAGQVSSTLGFSLSLKTQQFLARAGLQYVNDASAYSVAVAKVLDKEKELPIIIGQFKNAFGYNMPKDDLSQLDKYLTQMTDLYNESTIVHNASVAQRALTDGQGSYWRRLSNFYDESQLKDMFHTENSWRGVDNLPYTNINKELNFRWDKLTNKAQSLDEIAPGLKGMFPDKKIVLGETTDLVGDVWTISSKDQFTPGALSRGVLDLLDNKLAGAKYNLSREIPDVMGQGELQIVSNDIGYFMKKYGLDKDIQGTMTQTGNSFRWKGPEGEIYIARTTTPEGKFEWTANTMGFSQESSEGGKFYQGLYDWVDSLGPEHVYTATSGLTGINQYRATVNQIKFGLRSGQFSDNIQPNAAQPATRGAKSTDDSRVVGALEGNGETFAIMSKNITTYIEEMTGSTLGKNINLAEMTDQEINKVVGIWQTTKAEGSNEKSTGVNTLKMMRAIARDPNGTSKGGMENFANRAEDLLDNMPKPIPPRQSGLSLSEKLTSSTTVGEATRILEEAEASGLISREEYSKLMHNWFYNSAR